MFGRAISQCFASTTATCQIISRRTSHSNPARFDSLRKMFADKLPNGVQEAIKQIAKEHGYGDYMLETKPVSAVGENSYGLVLQAKITDRERAKDPFYCIVKIAPIHAARRTFMKVAEYYEREVFVYDEVFKAFKEIQEAESISAPLRFDSVPKKYFSSLKNSEEFIIVEDLSQDGFLLNSRKNMPNFDLTVSALKALARFHAMSFVLQARRPQTFEHLVDQIRDRDNLYTQHMDEVTVQFAKKYTGRAKELIVEDPEITPNEQANLIAVLEIFKEKFIKIALNAVNGTKSAPYSVICHGDFWNNNILYRYDEENKPSIAKLIDFQLARYASPVLDVAHFLFACTEKDLRDSHFHEFIQIYHNTLSDQLRLFHLNPDKIYPRAVLDNHVKEFFPFGLCMAIFSIPFSISDSDDLPDMDECSQVIHELKPKSSKQNVKEKERRGKIIVDSYEIMTEKTMPIFKRRILGVLRDLFKYDMVDGLKKFAESSEDETEKC